MKNHQKGTLIFVLIVVIIIVIMLPTFVERVLFGVGNYIPMTTNFVPQHILSYIGSILPIIPTAILGWVVWKQNERLHEKNTTLEETNVKIASDAFDLNEKMQSLNLELQRQNIEMTRQPNEQNQKMQELSIYLQEQ